MLSLLVVINFVSFEKPQKRNAQAVGLLLKVNLNSNANRYH
jgi:hypothetical protein